MLKIKKFLFIFGCSLALLMGCSNGNDTVESNNGNETVESGNGNETVETKKKIEIQNTDNYKGIFVVKYNYSDNFLPAKETGNFIVKGKNVSNNVLSSNISQMNNDYIKDFTLNGKSIDLKDCFINDTSKIDKACSELFNNVVKNTSRSVENTSIPVNSIKPESYEVGVKKDFYVLKSVADVKSSEQKEATLKACNDVCNVWFVDDCENVNFTDDSIFKNVAEKFKIIYDPEIEIMGAHKYLKKCSSYFIDPSQKINIIIYDIDYDSDPDQKGGVFGLFYGADMYTEEALNLDPKNQLKTNETQCIYLDSFFLSKDEKQVYSTLAHEFNHLLTFCNKTVIYGINPETWFKEMLSMITEDMLQNLLDIEDISSPKGRLPYFCQYYNYGFLDSWNRKKVNDSLEDTLINYANTYAYGAYLVRNCGGFDFLKRLATSNYINQAAIDDAIRLCNDSNEEISDFKSSIEFFSEIILDVYFKDWEHSSLNKKIIYENNNNVYFDAIELIYSESNKKYGPNIYEIDDQLDLGGQSFSIHQVEDYESIIFEYNENNNMDLSGVTYNY